MLNNKINNTRYRKFASFPALIKLVLLVGGHTGFICSRCRTRCCPVTELAMGLIIFVLLATYLGSAAAVDDENGMYVQPEQVHLAFGEKSNDIVVTWTTFNETESSVVEYGEEGEGLRRQREGGATLFVDGGAERRRMYIHRVTLRDLTHNTKYIYHAGSRQGWSELLFFRTPPAGEDWPVRAAVYGDMGVDNAQSMSYLQDGAQRGQFDLVLHVGDFAYDMDSDDARTGDQFMRQLQPLAGYLPYMVCPGNHEEKYNFSNYKARFSMPAAGGGDSMFYSFGLGRVHFVAVATEFYYYTNYGLKMALRQFEWLTEDLERANTPENRAKRPWIVLMGHRPMYCSNSDDIDCAAELTRLGLPVLGLALEPLLKRYGVDVVIWAHEHSYERSWPLYDHKVYNGSLHAPYTNPKAPVHIVTGSAGCKEDHSGFTHAAPHWSAFRSQDYGYTELHAANGTHLHFQQVSVEPVKHVIDDFWLIKEKHEAYDI